MTWSPSDYKEAAALAFEVGEEMLSRLEWMTIKPRVILELGCGPGTMVGALQTRYPASQVVGVDISAQMLNYAKQHAAQGIYLCSDAARLPLPPQSVDLIVANLLLPWHDDAAALIREWRRVLRADGLLMFSALGPDTLKAWQTLFHRHDMHDLGDLMLQEGFADPVLDINYYTLGYRDKEKLCQELAISEMIAADSDIPRIDELEVTYEVVFAHAFTPAETDEVAASSDGIVRVPLSHLRRKLG